MKLPLKWHRVESGLWTAGPYVLRRGTSVNGNGWRVTRTDVTYRSRHRTLQAAKAACAANYEG